MKTTIEAHEAIAERAGLNLKKMEVVKSIEIGEWVRQGDIYITRIEKITGTLELKSRKLVAGQTKGSRHIVEDSPHVKIFKGYIGKNIPNFMKGDQIKSETDFIITHPEHAHTKLPPGNYQVTYQMDWKQQNRVRD